MSQHEDPTEPQSAPDPGETGEMTAPLGVDPGAPEQGWTSPTPAQYPAYGQPSPAAAPPQQPLPQYGQPQPGPPAHGQPYGQPYGQSYAQSYGQPGYGATPGYQAPHQPAYQQTAAYPLAPLTGDTGARAKVPGWLWPAVAATALVVGLAGGALGGSLVAGNSGGDGSGGVLKVERRTAPPLPADNESIAGVAEKVLPSTVQIVAEFGGKAQGATGSGFVFDTSGHIITNNHVVAAAAKDDGPISVIDRDGRRYAATVVGRSTVYDIAVLKVKEAGDLTPIAIGSAEQMRVGETVVAIGSPLGLSATVTSGIISAVNRPVTTGDGGNDNSYINALQTDAAINPGNSGGPLVNLQGQVIGVNSAIASMGSKITSDQGGNIGVGFAIPVEQVLTTTDQILKTGKAQYPVMGASVRGTKEGDGATVEAITDGSPAARSELKVGDVVRKVDGKPVTSSIDLVVAIRTHVPGDEVTLLVERGGKPREIKVGLDAKTG